MKSLLKDNDYEGKRYILYARKSTESEDRQVASIGSQITVMNNVKDELNLNVVGLISESSSGFKIGRKEFNRMLNMIQDGEADSILVWKLSRLARNPDDAGRIMGMLQRGEIKHIRTFDRDWFPSDNVMMMYVEFGVTNQFSKDLSDDTVRGLNQKSLRGWSPKSNLPLGYMHNPYKKTDSIEIFPDPERFEIIQKALKKVASGEMSPRQALNYANDLGLRTKATKRFKSKEVTDSVFYRMLSDPFYYGLFEYPKGSGNWIIGKHEKAISEEEYNLIQRYKGRKNAPRPQKHLFPYTGLMRCGECGCSIVVDPKEKIQKNGNKHSYHYYRCTKAKGNCSQKYLERKELEKQLADILGSIEISEDFHNWALEELKNDIEKDITDRDEITMIAQEGYNDSVNQINKLVKAYAGGKVPEDAYLTTIKELQSEKDKFKLMLDTTDERIQEFVSKTEQNISFAKTAQKEFEAGDIQKKNSILNHLGANIVIKDLKVSIDIQEPLLIIKKGEQKFVNIQKELEPLENLSVKDKNNFIETRNTTMGG
jgi:site-specific DNA recombinase